MSTINNSTPKRFYQLRFKGFRPSGGILRSFLISLLKYFSKKIRDLFGLILWLIKFARQLPAGVKAYFIKKLIWSRGKLGRKITNAAVIFVALLVFSLGEIFNSSKFVSGGEVDPDYLGYTSDIIPNMNTAQTLIPENRKQTEAFSYTVVSGDTLSGIGEKFKISVDALKYVNSLTDYSVLKVGQTVTIPPISGLIHKVGDGDSLESIAKKYAVASQAIADFNYILDTSKLAVGTELVIPGAKVPQQVVIIPSVPNIIPNPGGPQAAPSNDFCVWPTTTRIITQYFTWYHNGLDIATPSGRGMPPIFACGGGTVVRAGWDPWGLGLHVRIDHGNGYESVYGHMSVLYVSYGEYVDRGQAIGLMGSTGRSTGPHLHYMIKYQGVPQNPFDYTN